MKLKTTLFLFLSTLFFYNVQAQCNGATFEEKNGIAVIETETASLPGSWKKETNSTPFTGSSYITWRGSDFFNNPGNGTINYQVKINSAGTYRFIWRNKVGIIANHPRPSTEHNDSWLKVLGAADFYGEKGTKRVYPKGSGKTPTANGAGGNGFFKVYASGTTNWTWSTNTNDENPHQIYVRFGNPGVYTIQVAARSKGHFIDRMVLYKEGSYSATQAQSLARGETKCGGGNPPPPPPPPPADDPVVNSFSYINANNNSVIGTLSNGAQLNLNNIPSNLSFRANANSDTESVRMVLSGPVSNTRTDNNVPYSAFGDSNGNYTGRNIQTGSYTLTATPYGGDNLNGAQGSASTISFTVVDTGNPPPPPPPPPADDPVVNSFRYINANNNNVIGTLSNGTQLNLNNIPNNLSFSAIANSDTESVRMVLSGPVSNTRTDNNVPYSAFGDSNGNYTGRNIQTGSYTLTATPYAGDNLNGAQGSASTISFTVVDTGNPPPPPPPPPPADNDDPTVSISSPNNGQNFNAGSDVTVGLSASDSDGSITKHEIFVNNSKVDTDGSSYSPYVIRDISPGNYAIRATVTDNDGATASVTVNITVGNATPPPPPPPSNNVITGFRLINAGNDNSIGNITEGKEFNLSVLPSSLNMQATTSPSSIGSVSLSLSGPTSNTRNDSSSPYAVFGESGGNYSGRSLPAGNYTITATPSNGSGLTVNFKIIDNDLPPPPPPPSGAITQFVLVNAETNSDIGKITPGRTFSSNGLPSSLSIRADSNPASIGTVSLSISGPINASKSEGLAPYHIFGDIGLDPIGRSFPNGDYTVSANSASGGSLSVQFSIGATQDPVTFTLINSITDEDIQPITEGTNLETCNKRNIRANVPFSNAKSVFFNLTGPNPRTWTENVVPYALFGDISGDYFDGNLSAGSYTLTVEVYSGSNRTGSLLITDDVTFTVGSTSSKLVTEESYVYPNPIKNGKFTVKLPAVMSGDVYYSVINTAGVQIETGKLSNARSGADAAFDLNSFDQKNVGVYYLVLRSNGYRHTVALIKE